MVKLCFCFCKYWRTKLSNVFAFWKSQPYERSGKIDPLLKLMDWDVARAEMHQWAGMWAGLVKGCTRYTLWGLALCRPSWEFYRMELIGELWPKNSIFIPFWSIFLGKFSATFCSFFWQPPLGKPSKLLSWFFPFPENHFAKKPLAENCRKFS